MCCVFFLFLVLFHSTRQDDVALVVASSLESQRIVANNLSTPKETSGLLRPGVLLLRMKCWEKQWLTRWNIQYSVSSVWHLSCQFALEASTQRFPIRPCETNSYMLYSCCWNVNGSWWIVSSIPFVGAKKSKKWSGDVDASPLTRLIVTIYTDEWQERAVHWTSTPSESTTSRHARGEKRQLDGPTKRSNFPISLSPLPSLSLSLSHYLGGVFYSTNDVYIVCDDWVFPPSDSLLLFISRFLSTCHLPSLGTCPHQQLEPSLHAPLFSSSLQSIRHSISRFSSA